MLNINELVIIIITLNYQINKLVTLVESCYTVTNWVVFGFVISDSFIIRVMFELANTIENLLST